MRPTRIPGLLLLALSLTAPALSAQSANPRGELLAADLAWSDSARSQGFAEGFTSALAADVVYLHPGAPVVRGASNVRALLAAQPAARVRWQPLRVIVSADGSAGASFGVTTRSAEGEAAGFGRYIAYWRHDPTGWRVAAVMLTSPPAGAAPTPEAAASFQPDTVGSAASGDRPSVRARAAAERADRDFAADAGVRGAGPAFERAAAPGAITFSGAGPLRLGPAEIGAAFGGGPPSQWAWRPVASEAADSGDLAFTVGTSEITGPGPNGPQTSYGKYLTIWQRQPDGTWKYVTDGGNPRPAQ
jgi:ketosteroid isomerase-like protein